MRIGKLVFLSNKKNPFILLFVLLLPGVFLAQNASAQAVIDYSYDDLNRLTGAGRSDGPAINYGYDETGNITSRAVSGSPDTDGDQIANFADPDDDNDLMPDAWELQYGLDPLDPSDANSNTDGDAYTAYQEYLNGTDPTDPLNGNVAVMDEEIPFVPVWGLGIMALILMLAGGRKAKSSSMVPAVFFAGLLSAGADNDVHAQAQDRRFRIISAIGK